MCSAVPAGALKFREGPVLVAKTTEHFFFEPWPESAQVFACVSVYQLRPSVMLLGAASHCSVPYGSKAFGQPFQPGSGAFDQTCHVPIRSGCPKSVPPSSTPTVTPRR